MAYPYKKMDEADFEYIRSVTAPDGMKCRNMEFFLRSFMWK